MSASGRSNKINFCDFDGIKKKEMERRKKLRLEQVRTQSKELSSQIRDRVAREKHRQLRNVEEIKRKELLSWKEKHVNNTMADYYYCLSNVGDAHVAAERENQLTEQQNEQQRKNRKIAVQRGRDALHKERLANVRKKERGAIKRKQNLSSGHEIGPNTVNATEEVSRLMSNDDDHQQSESDDEVIAKNVDTVRDTSIRSPGKHLADELVDKPKEHSMFRFTKVSDLIEERRRARHVCDQILESEFATVQPEIHSTSSQKSPQSKPSHAPKPPQPKLFHAPKSPQAKPLYTPKSPKQPTKSTVQRSPVSAKGFVPKLPTAGSKGFNSQRSVVGNARKVISPNKVVKPRNVVTSSKFVSPQRREFVPRFNIPGILKNKPAPETTKEVTTESIEKVQFYDHFSRYGKEYEAVPGMVVRESQDQAMDANEAARVQNEMDELRFKQLEEWKRKSEQRSIESLQRNQVRKDYDNLTKQLDALCKEENRLRAFAMPPDQFSEDRISQLARNRQQSMNRAFENIHHRPVVITCPPIGTNEHSSSSDLNVAASPPTDKQRPYVDPLDSSDSCTSILLGYVDNRSRKLVKDIKQCKDGPDGDKRKRLVTLLTRLDGLRKVLMEEIVRNSSLNLEPFYRSVLEVETEQKEILHDPLANKENGDTRERTEPLNLREQSQEMKLEKKIRELFRKEQAKASRNDNTFESVTSETIGSRDDPEPVKILIEVKNGAKIRKSSNPKNADAHIVVGQRERKTSVVSSASTAYRSPPATFHTDFTKVLSNQADALARKSSTQPNERTKPLEQTPLAHYITRLLGMSQKSVDQLGVSTGSSITTPSDSVIEVAENRSVIDASHLSRVQAKIDDSLRLVKEVDDSFKQPKRQTATKVVTTTKHTGTKEREVTPSEERQAQTNRHANRHHHSNVAAKTPEKSKKVTHRSKSQSDSIGHGGNAVEVANIPENSKRIIANLTKQIEQVRQDKQRLLEKTLSSAQSSHSSSGKDFDLTEYKDFVTASKPTSKQPDENDRSSQASDVQSSPGQFVNEEAKNLMSTKQIGISFSRDSGIGSSRPVTSTDFRISPDIKLAEKSTPSQFTQVLGADPPFVGGDPLAAPEEAVRKSVETGVRKPAKPPISLKRYSPQLDTEQLQPHDLSTINEVETSAASRLNQSTRNETSGSPVPTPYTRFPTFAEYAKMQEIESVDASSDVSYSETILKKMLEVTCLSETDLNYRKFDRTHPKDRTNNEQSTNTGTFTEFIDVEKEMKQRRLMERADASSTSDSKLISSSTSSDILAKDFNRIGLNWASAMLKKTSTAQNLESSSSSIKSTPIAAPTLSGGSSPGDRINGNPLNIRDFLARELLKRSQMSSSSSMSDSSTLTDQFLKSLLTMSSDSSLHQQATLRTSTPNRLNQSSESEKFVAAHDIGHTAKDEHLFSGESVLSSVRGLSQSETSGGRETSE
ncbi:uncharacterized protein LOC119075235 [Bradysia coprophila]|uniref:uncharacterized protein LOC119075235 n=1 Tax=Bradysia coprophila TaxID=38358 RepID=UPI00187D75C1|nr:uncharacterized protein LOC119075235 [Bradysia coprophila]